MVDSVFEPIVDMVGSGRNSRHVKCCSTSISLLLEFCDEASWEFTATDISESIGVCFRIRFEHDPAFAWQ
jgi:hypothetical protein